MLLIWKLFPFFSIQGELGAPGKQGDVGAQAGPVSKPTFQ
jgi:hypothetical protein